MKKTQITRLAALATLCIAAVGHSAYSQPAMITGAAAKAPAAVETEDGPPSYMLVLAGLSAIVFVGARRRKL